MDAKLQGYIDKLNALNFKEMYNGDFFLTWEKTDDEIEAVFTVDEEIGMGGAHHLDTSVLKGKICLNIDSEIEGVMTVGCAGGYIYDTFIPIEWSEESGTKMTISLSNLQGGHSGAEIDKNRANAN